MVQDRDNADAARRWGFVFAIARTWKTVDDKTLKNPGDQSGRADAETSGVYLSKE
jgi:hypothetical protein